ncbi:MAG: alpha/beta fold hydrolase [Jatrophihabitantaceae bacterium]
MPFAGAGASFYRCWPPATPSVDVLVLQLPGRDERFTEPVASSVAQCVSDLLAQLSEQPPQSDFGLFGHSFGALLAFELARRLVALGTPPRCLVVSGSADPGHPLTRRSTELNDQQFVARVEELAGYAHPALADEEMRELMLPALRGDVELHESYRTTDTEPLPIPIVALRGDRDELVTADDSRGWATWTSVGFQLRELPGGHMYLAEQPIAVQHALAEAMSEVAHVSHPAGR